MKNILIYILLLIATVSVAQTEYAYYMHVVDYTSVPEFEKDKDEMVYVGNNPVLAAFFADYTILKFSQAFPAAQRAINLNVFVLETLNSTLAQDMVNTFPAIFTSYEDITDVVIELLYYPNDYGPTSPDPNNGVFDRRELDYIDAPTAWDITTGNNTDLVISDARVNETIPDFAGLSGPSKIQFVNECDCQGDPYDPEDLESFHGTNVAGIAAANGDNDWGTPGVCYDCGIVMTHYGVTEETFNVMTELAIQGYRVFNMSWASVRDFIRPPGSAIQNIITELVDDYGAILIAAAGNKSSFQTENDFRDKKEHLTQDIWIPLFTETQYGYPASYDGVISVSSIHHYYNINDPNASVNNGDPSPSGLVLAKLVEDSFSGYVALNNDPEPKGVKYHGFPIIVNTPSGLGTQTISPLGLTAFHTTNEFVDILAPTHKIMLYHKFVEESTIGYDGQGTSGATPFVSGTVALMIDVNDCLSPYEAEAILKLTAKDVEHMPLNDDFFGLMGAGKLETGKAVVFTDEIKKTNGVAEIKDHIFYRYDFELLNIMNDLTIENVQFIEDARVEFRAANSIELLEDTLLEPNSGTYIDLSIDPNNTPCTVTYSYLKPEGPTNESFQEEPEEENYRLAPNAVAYKTQISKKEPTGDKISYVLVYNMLGILVYKKDKIDTYETELDLSGLSKGMYIVTGFSKTNEVLFNKKVLKK